MLSYNERTMSLSNYIQIAYSTYSTIEFERFIIIALSQKQEGVVA